MTPLPELTAYLDDYLRVREIVDYPNALNGLQLENAAGRVSKLAAAVDARAATVDLAAYRGCDALLVHHGLFWSGAQPITGGRFRLLRRALEAGVAIYSAHLPLDAHPTVGNNAGLCVALGLGEELTPFFPYKGTPIGLRGRAEIDRDELVRRLERAVGGPVKVCPGGPAVAREIGVITGGAGGQVQEIAALGVDTFITGEGAHWTHALAEELGVNILYGGHYATETFGVRALAAHLGERFGLLWEFLDVPTGL